MKNIHETQLTRIADQADLLAMASKILNRLYAKQADPGSSPVTADQIEAAVHDMQAAFMAVLRVTAEYL